MTTQITITDNSAQTDRRSPLAPIDGEWTAARIRVAAVEEIARTVIEANQKRAQEKHELAMEIARRKFHLKLIKQKLRMNLRSLRYNQRVDYEDYALRKSKTDRRSPQAPIDRELITARMCVAAVEEIARTGIDEKQKRVQEKHELAMKIARRKFNLKFKKYNHQMELMSLRHNQRVDYAFRKFVRRTRSGRAVKPINNPAPKTRGRKKASLSEEEDFHRPTEIVKERVQDISENSNGVPHIMDDAIADQQYSMIANDDNEQFSMLETAENCSSDTENVNRNSGENFQSSGDEENAASSESEMDADEENVDNQIIEISSGTAADIRHRSVNLDSSGSVHEYALSESEGTLSQDQSISPEKYVVYNNGSGSENEDSSIVDNEVYRNRNRNSSSPEEDEVRSQTNSEVTDYERGSSLCGSQATPTVTEDTSGSRRSSAFNSQGTSITDEAPENLDNSFLSMEVHRSDGSSVLEEELPEDVEKTEAEEKSAEEEEDPDTEMVSEDELPAPQKAKVPEDAEEVSDDELPGPKLAELPADTEVVSEDELPAVKAAKRKHEDESGYDPSSPTGTRESSTKRLALDSSVEVKEEKEEKKAVTKTRKLPELDKYWKAVRDDPSDFAGWTHLLQYVDQEVRNQENEIEPAREAYDAFLAHYPYCYGYWRKYADYEKRKGNKKKCEEVFERGLRAIPLSVDLWLHFLTYQKTTYGEDEARIREQYERAINASGLEFRSDRLWEGYIKWETEGKRHRNVMQIYDRLLAIPTFGYTAHFDSFQEFVSQNQPPVILLKEEFLTLRAESRSDKNVPVDSNIPPGEDEADDNMRNDEESESIKQLIISSRRKIHKNTVAEVTARWSFEEGIKRPYFHVRPLELCQLNNWKDYLDYETQHGTRDRVLILYERCLIACALYEEFWLRLIRYLEMEHDDALIPHTRDVFERACTIHHPDKATLHLLWAAFEENYGSPNKAAEILIRIEKTCPNVLQITYRRINLERRRGDLDKCRSLFEHYIQTLKNKSIVAGLVIKYARFCHKIQGDMNKALEILKEGIEREPNNARLSLQLIDLYMQRDEINTKEIIEVLDAFLAREPEADQKILFAQRKLEFLEDFGTAEHLQEAQRYLQQTLAKANKKKDLKRDSSPSKKSKDGSGSAPPLPPNNSYQGANNTQYGSPYGSSQSTQGGAYGGYPAHGSYNQGYAQSSGEYPPYQWGQYSQGQYSGYGAWGGYPNYY